MQVEFSQKMNRQAKRQKQREMSKIENVISKLTPEQIKIIDHLSTVKAKQKSDMELAEIAMTIDRNLSAALITLGLDLKQVDKIESLISELTEEDSLKYKEMSKKYSEEEFRIIMKKIDGEIRKEIEKLLEKKLSKKQAIEELQFKFSTLSKSMITNAYQKVKEELEENKKEEADDLEVEAALKYIFEEEKEVKKEDKTVEIKEVESNVSNNAITENNHIAEDGKMVKEETKVKAGEVVVDTSEGLQVLEEIKIFKVKGNNGEYEADSRKGVILSREDRSIYFENEEQLDEWVNEFKRVFGMIK